MEIVATEAARRGVGYLTRSAEHSPVTITKHGRPVAVVLAEADYRRLLDATNTEHFVDTWEDLGVLLRNRRRQLRWTLDDTAQRAAVGTRFIHDLEHAVARPEIALILQVAHALHLTLTGLPTRAPGPWTKQLLPPDSNTLPEQP